MKSILIIFFIMVTLSSSPIWAKNNEYLDENNMYFSLVESIYLASSVENANRLLNLYKNKNVIPKDSFKKQEEIFLCTDLFLHSDYLNFLKMTDYKSNKKLLSTYEKQVVSSGKRLEKEKMDCKVVFEDMSIDDIYSPVLDSLFEIVKLRLNTSLNKK
ncbi:hypothetical protein GPS60_12975 [Acinetobacter haemolyticus]|uniref:hypothetical protein n=1 Tax=Acinetobacter haemolyticus TaxID=29430 RepID=UPI001372A04F|nr:hypothetical protein [Acinetobacter haemolyticus]NAR48525.1 hypothetical protein [Acinetobacter haemolyticus]